jgi:hypothetical protein
MPHIFVNVHNDIYEVSCFTDNKSLLELEQESNKSDKSDKSLTLEIIADELEKAKNGEHPTIKYIGPNYFQKNNIPKYFHLVDMEVADVDDISKKMNKKTYFIFPSFSDNSVYNLNLFVKDANGCVNIYPLILKHNDNKYPQKVTGCCVELYDIELNEKLEEENVITSVLEASNIETFVDKYFTKQRYTPVTNL